MAQPTYKHTYKICPVFEHNCSNYNIQILSESTVEIPCDDPKCIEFGIEEGSPNQCIEFLVTCLDCGSCPSQYYKKCFCTTKDDCSECQDCNQLGICEDKCKTTEFCKDDTCLECDDTHPCPPDKKCVGGKCVCPTGTKKDPQGRCVQCFPTDDLGKCRICVDGVITPIPCDGVCDESNGCVDCLNSNDCSKNTDGRNCCNNKQCGCCPGYVWSFEQNKCILPPCIDEECGPCKKCGPNGCEPVTCPPGFKCDPNVDDCVPDPCNSAPCENGADCGPECGCKGEVCTECAKLSCEECAKSLGCVCNETTNFVCAKVNKCDDSPCVTKHDCSEDCGCDKSVCQECENYSCEECGKIPGCKCNPNTKKCEGDGDRGCKDSFTLKPLDSCKGGLEATLTKNSSCACGDITVGIYQQPSGANFPNLNLQFRKGSGDWDSLINFNRTDSDKISDKEKNTETYTITFKYELLTSTGVKVKESLFTRSLASIGDILNTGDISIASLTDTEIAKGKKFRVTATIQDVKITENLCIYKGKTLLQDIFDVQYTATTARPVFPDLLVEPETAWLKEYVKLESDSIRKPLFVWYRSKNSTFGNNDIVKRKYVDPKSLNTFVDSLTLDEGFLPKFDYLVTNDCSCVRSVSLDNVVICEDKELPVKLTNCNTKLTITDDLTVCDASNKSLAPYIRKGSTKPNITEDIEYAQVQFIFAINGTPVDTFMADAEGKLKKGTSPIKGLVYDLGTTINLTELYVEVDGVKACIKENKYNNPIVTIPDPTSNCEGTPNLIFNSTGIREIKFGENTYKPENGRFIIVFPSDGTYTLTFITTDNCTLDKEYTISCCATKSIALYKNGVQVIDEDSLFNSNSDISYDITVSGFSNSATYTTNFGTISTSPTKTLTLTVADLASLTNQDIITVTAKENGCEKSVSIRITKLDFTFTVSSSTCGEGTLTLTGVAGAEFSINRNGTGWVPSQNMETSIYTKATENAGTTGEVKYILRTYKGVLVNYEISYTKLAAPTVTSIDFIEPSGTDCTGNSIEYKINGTGIVANTTKVKYTLNGTPNLEATVFAKGSEFFIAVDRPTSDKAEILIDSVSNAGTCVSEVAISDSSSLKLPSNIQVSNGVCNPSIEKYEYTLSVADLAPGSYVFSVPASTSGAYTYDSGTKKLTINKGFVGVINITTVVNISLSEQVQRCPQAISFNVPTTCNADLRTVSRTSVEAACLTTQGSSHNFTFVNGIEFTISPYADLTYSTANTGDVRLVVIANGVEYTPSGVGASFANGVLTVTAFSIPTTANLNNLSLKVTVAQKGAYAFTESTAQPIAKYDKTYVSSAGFNQFLNIVILDDRSGPTRVNVGERSLLDLENDSEFAINQGQPYKIGFRYTGALSSQIPDDFTIDLINPQIQNNNVVKTFTKGEIVGSYTDQNLPVAEMFATSGFIIGFVTKKLPSCGGVGSYDFAIVPIPTNTIVVNRGVNPVGYIETFCDDSSSLAEVFSHELSGDLSATTVWSYDRFSKNPLQPSTTNIFTSNSNTLVFNPVNNATDDNFEYRLFVTVTTPGQQYEEAVYIEVNTPQVPIFSQSIPDTLTQGTGIYTLPNPVNHAELLGSWSPVSINTASTGTTLVTYTPGISCSQTYSKNITVNAAIPGAPVVIGGTSGCEKVTMEVTSSVTGTLYVRNSTTPPPNNNTPPPNTVSSVAVTSGVPVNIDITASGNYSFVVHNGVNYSTSTIVNGILITTKGSIGTPSLPTVLNVGSSYALPSTLNGYPGTWNIGSVNTTTPGPRSYTFTPNGCYNNYVWNFTVVCTNDVLVVNETSTEIIVSNPSGFFNNISVQFSSGTSVGSAGETITISKSNVTYFPDTNVTYDVVVTGVRNGSGCPQFTTSLTHCRCSVPSCEVTSPIEVDVFSDGLEFTGIPTASGQTFTFPGVIDTSIIANAVVSQTDDIFYDITSYFSDGTISSIGSNRIGTFRVQTPTINISDIITVNGVTYTRSGTMGALIAAINGANPDAVAPGVNNPNALVLNVRDYPTPNFFSGVSVDFGLNPNLIINRVNGSSTAYSKQIIFASQLFPYDFTLSYSDNLDEIYNVIIPTTVWTVSGYFLRPEDYTITECQ